MKNKERASAYQLRNNPIDIFQTALDITCIGRSFMCNGAEKLLLE
jgi:hypothetical protein